MKLGVDKEVIETSLSNLSYLYINSDIDLEDRRKIAILLINNGAKLDIKYKRLNRSQMEDINFIFNAIEKNDLELVKFILEKYPELIDKTINPEGQTPITVAKFYYRKEILQFLLDKKANSK
ncbi:MAG: ankyrin repeat domain-containing protein [Cyanobacteriota bacterium]